ncbi:SusC/RagA family TonB-linked outer membrane protein [Mucilaginibacter pedocola]|uniref:TonB-dependent receptor plug domain-containing protein n=1 Tax=Mucilaginibacter pedocola TaxID=1792845 RepID=A0A1S9PFN5_9SPHI|nr:TonB-dependent receptor [Mucilaginibacter pedocola]OOQ59766.1 hypothetical protein BC343_06320 [Mucilaginibacter pedocola]
MQLATKQLAVLLAFTALLAGTNAGAYAAPLAHATHAAEIKIHGTITDSKGNTLPGVSIRVKGSTKGTISDLNGNYTLAVTTPAVVVYSFVGFTTQEVNVTDQTTVNVKLLEGANALSQVVVVGYGTQSKRNVTGSVAKVDLSQTRDLPNTNVTESIRGRVPGVQFNSNGRPGQNGTILVRGARSLGGNNNPLIVVDGVFFNGSLSDINPNDIESIDILKDASAAAIYGSRAANGVLLITSKKGTTEKPIIRFNLYTGVSDAAHTIKLLSADRYLEKTLDYQKEIATATSPAIKTAPEYLTTAEKANYDAGKVIDPWKEASQNAIFSSADVSVSAKAGKTSFYNSASYTNEKGILYNDNQKRVTLRSNIETSVTDWLKIGMASTFVNRDLSGIASDLNSLYYSSPYGTWRYADGEPTQFSVPTETISGNPIRSSILTKNEEIARNLFANFYGILNIPQVPGLAYRVNFSPNYRWDHTYNATRQDLHLANNTKSASKFNQESYDYVIENILTYNKYIGTDHYFDVTLLYGRNRSGFESTTASGAQLTSDALGWNSLQFAGTPTIASSAQLVNGISSMARLNYRFKERYLLTLTARRDGSSVFAKNNKYATFPSASLAWIISDEPFLKNNETLSSLKLRLSYGSVGNQAISPYQSLSLSNTNNYVYGNPGVTALGVFPANIANDNLKWETTYTTNLGLEFGLFKNRITGTLELYNSKTKDLLVTRAIPVMTGFTSVLTNLGETNNKGIELALNIENIKGRKFTWTTNITASANANKIVHLYGSDVNNDGKEDDDVANNWFIGKPITSFYGYQFDGIYQQGDVIPAGSQPGFIRFKDLNGDGVINASDRSVVASGGLPKFMGGLGNTFTYGGFSLNIFVNTMLGWKTPFILLDPNSSISENSPGRALNQIDAGWWTPENKSTTRPSLVYTNPLGYQYYVSRNFVRIQDVTLGYNIPKSIVEKLKMANLRVYVSGKNLHTFTNYPGSDPEINPGTSAATIKSNMYPLVRTISFGVNAGF